MKDRNLMVITKWFPSEGTSFSSPFVYYLTKEVSKYFKKVYVFSLNPKIPKILRKKAFLTRIGYDKRWHNDIYSKKYMTPYSFKNIEVFYVSYSDIVSRISFNIEMRRVYRHIISEIASRKLKIDFIHAHFLFPTGYLSAMIKEKLGIPLVVSGHGSDVYSLPFKNRKFLSAIKWTIKKADHIITPSERNRKILEKVLGAMSERVSVIPNGYDADVFFPMDKKEVRKKLGLNPEKKIIVSVGNLIPVKGYDILIEAMAHVRKKTRDVQCVIVGDGGMRKTLEEKIRKLSLKDDVILTGNIPHEEIPMWINASDIFVISSLDEGNPTVMFEALGCGKPVIATSVGGIPEIIRDKDVGILVPPKNLRALSEAILSALERKWSTEYIANFSEKFSWKKIGEKTLEVYKKYI